MRPLLIASLLLASLSHAQTSTPDIATDAVAHFIATIRQQANYTFLDTEHDLSYIDGKRNDERTTVSETIELEGMPYTRKLQIDGKPLSGKALAYEQQLYDRAIKERSSVDDLRAKESKSVQYKTDTSFNRLPLDYTNRVIGHESFGGRACVELLFEPKPEVSPAPTKKITLWIDLATHDVLRIDQVLLVTENKILAGSIYSYRFTPVDSVLLENQLIADVTWNEAHLHDKRIHLIATHTYTNYRRFRTTVTISPAPTAPQ